MQDKAALETQVTGEQDALRPVTSNEKTWGWFGIFNVWANDVQSLFGYSLVASLFISFGVSGWTAFTALVLSGLFVMYMVNLSGAAGKNTVFLTPFLHVPAWAPQGRNSPQFSARLLRCFGMASKSTLPPLRWRC